MARRARGWACALAAWAALVLDREGGVGGGKAEPRTARVNLWPERLPFRPRMAMRVGATSRSASVTGPGAVTGSGSVSAAAAASAAAVASSTRPGTPPVAAGPLRFADSRTARRARARTAAQAASVRAQLITGFAVDGAGPSATGLTLAGLPIAEGARDLDGYARARAYGFGALYLGGRNLVLPGLHGYLAAQGQVLPTTPDHAPVATVRDQIDATRVSSAWAEADQVVGTALLRPLALRAGRQYVYGPYIAHLDGVRLRWRRGWLDASVYAGSRVPDWAARSGAPRALAPQRGLVTGAELALDLRRTRVPVLVRLRALAYQDHGHADLTVDSRVRRALDLTAVARTYDGAIAHEQVTVRYRLSDRTRLVIDAGYRHRRDPLWDLAYRDRDDEVGAARRYLDLGPRLPRATVRVRAGTVLLDNVDLLVSGGGALDAHGGDDPADESRYAASWLEGGGALEVRVRRTFALGISGLVRAYNRSDPEPDAIVVDVEDTPAPLVLPVASVGEQSLIEGGVSARFSGGARRFSVTAEIYARRTRYAELYRDDGVADGDGLDLEANGVIGRDGLRGGGRVTLDAWVTERVRLRGEYDVSTTVELAPETRGAKSLRIVAEGTL